MQQSQYPRFVVCKNEDCRKPIPIPYSNLLRILPFHEATNPDAGAENFACLGCGHVFYYTPEDARSHDPSQAPAQDQETRLRVGIVSFDCAENKCGFRVEILVPSPAGQSLQDVRASSTTWTLRKAYCKRGRTKGHAVQVLPDLSQRTVSFSVP